MKTIALSKGQFAIVDDEDFELLNEFKWCVTSKTSGFYAQRRAWDSNRKDEPKYNGYLIYMHRQILKADKEIIVDHINRNTLDNRKCNLRTTNKSGNAINAKHRKNCTGYRGVRKQSKHNSFTAKICINQKLIYLGNFKLAKDAAVAYNEAAIKYHGEFANLNIIGD